MNLDEEAQNILDRLASLPFENCYRLSRMFRDVPTNPALYAVRHCVDGILYIGTTNNLRRRFKDGHKALSWAFIDRYDSDDVRITPEFLPPIKVQHSEELETLMIRIAHPSYNSLVK